MSIILKESDKVGRHLVDIHFIKNKINTIELWKSASWAMFAGEVLILQRKT